MRSEHLDSKYAFIYYLYFKEFSIKYREHVAVALLDDTVNVPVVEPNHTILTILWPHSKSFTSSSVTLKVLDHDLKVAGNS